MRRVINLIQDQAFFNMGFKNDWRKILPQDIIEKMNRKFRAELKELGYN